MLRVTIELLPYGQEDKARTLQTLTIMNVGGTAERGTYICTLTDEFPFPVCTDVIEDWPRLERDAAALVHEALSRMGYGANAPARNRGEVITPALRDHARRIAQSVIREMEDRNLEVNGRYPSRGEP